MRRVLITMVMAALGVGLLAGCGPRRGATDDEIITALTPEAAALVSLGFDTEQLATGDVVGVAGVEIGGQPTARLVVIPQS
jgi:hypothetical protein